MESSLEPMKPMAPMAPMQPMSQGEAWWPQELGQPSTSGAQDGLRYAFFPEARRLVVERGGRRQTFDSGAHRISGVSQASGRERSLVLSGDEGEVDLQSLPLID